MAPTVRAPEEVRDSIDRTRTRLHVDSVDLAPGSVRLVHADSQQALVSMAEMWAKAGGRSLMLTRRAEDVPEGVHHLWIHEGALNLPDVALGDEPLLVVSVDLHLLSVMLGPEVAASSFADVLDHGRERGAVHLLHIDEQVLTTAEMARFSRYGAPMPVDDVAALASDERSLKGLSGFDMDAILRTRERLSPGLKRPQNLNLKSLLRSSLSRQPRSRVLNPCRSPSLRRSWRLLLLPSPEARVAPSACAPANLLHDVTRVSRNSRPHAAMCLRRCGPLGMHRTAHQTLFETHPPPPMASRHLVRSKRSDWLACVTCLPWNRW